MIKTILSTLLNIALIPFWLGVATLLTGLSFVKSYFEGARSYLAPNLTGKVSIVTGASSGMGYHVAHRLAELGALVVIACRNVEKGQKVANKIRKDVKDAKIDVIHIDLADLKTVRKFVEVFKSKYTRLEILVNNAGIFKDKKVVTVDGMEKDFQVNYLSHYLLTMLLKDYLVKSAPSRVVVVGSELHWTSHMRWNNLMMKGEWSIERAYGQSKIANLLFTKEFNKRYEYQGVKAVSIHPGVVISPIYNDLLKHTLGQLTVFLLAPLIYLTAKNENQGAQTTIHCALLGHEALVGGGYYKECALGKSSAEASNMKNALRLWKKSLELLNMKESDFK